MPERERPELFDLARRVARNLSQDGRVLDVQAQDREDYFAILLAQAHRADARLSVTSRAGKSRYVAASVWNAARSIARERASRGRATPPMEVEFDRAVEVDLDARIDARRMLARLLNKAKPEDLLWLWLLAECDGSVSEVAKTVGLHRFTVSRKVQKSRGRWRRIILQRPKKV